jgi:hypothetical protein
MKSCCEVVEREELLKLEGGWGCSGVMARHTRT